VGYTYQSSTGNSYLDQYSNYTSGIEVCRLVITAVLLEGRSQAEVARTYGVSESFVSRALARYRAEGIRHARASSEAIEVKAIRRI